MSIGSKNKGKSGVARVITHFALVKSQILLISIFDKSEQSSITTAEINERLKKYF
jgi:hypothetical protein